MPTIDVGIFAFGAISLRDSPSAHPEEGLIIVFYGKSQLARRTSYARAVAQTSDLPTKTVISPSS